MKLRISRRARSQIERIQAWWVENRPASPALFLDELAATERRLRAAPELGAVYTEGKGGVVRRVVLPKTQHHIYYRIDLEGTELMVLVVWGARRGRLPKL